MVLSPPLSVLAEGGTEKLSDLPKVTQLVLKEINLQSSLEGLMLKLKLQNFGHLVRRASSLEETLMLGNIESRERRGRQTMRWLDGITDSMSMNLKVEEEFEHTLGDGRGGGNLACCSSWVSKRRIRPGD